MATFGNDRRQHRREAYVPAQHRPQLSSSYFENGRDARHHADKNVRVSDNQNRLKLELLWHCNGGLCGDSVNGDRSAA